MATLYPYHGLCLSLSQECGVEVAHPFPNKKKGVGHDNMVQKSVVMETMASFPTCF